ncbi:hypothetical protein SAMN02800691_0839 [Luteibacter sp. UNCMF366Tsu5.1]|nr:hypothetical protein SAMN02800691_0839 [Luteibacter sp. UNCMF366Tsu5.1]
MPMLVCGTCATDRCIGTFDEVVVGCYPPSGARGHATGIEPNLTDSVRL